MTEAIPDPALCLIVSWRAVDFALHVRTALSLSLFLDAIKCECIAACSVLCIREERVALESAS